MLPLADTQFAEATWIMVAKSIVILAVVGKLISKESFRPENAISTLFVLGPLLPVLAGVLSLAIIPWGDVQDGVGFYGIDVPIGILYFFAVGSIAFSQGEVWFILPQFVGCLIFMLAGFAETNRTPFDMPEADAELVQGFMTEYGGMRFGSFLLVEYMEILVVSGIAAAMFLGGWMGP